MNKADIVIIDSGIDSDIIGEKETNKAISINFQNDLLEVDKCCQDDIGHGTAIYSIIRKNAPSASILMIKAFDISGQISEDKLIVILEYIKNNISCHIINLSCGIQCCNDEDRLEQLCIDLQKKGCIIISAFDNEGCYSFPAAFSSVIGVDGAYQCKNIFDFEFVEGNRINVRGKGGIQRVKWKEGKVIPLGGASFACAYVAAYIANKWKDRLELLTAEDALATLKQNSQKIYYKNNIDGGDLPTGICTNFTIEKAAVFPFNKEMHSLLRFSDKLNFCIKAVYDICQLGRVGASTSKILNLPDEQNYIVQDVKMVDYDNIDCIVLGHLDEINRVLKQDIRKEILLKCIDNKVNVYSFDPLDYCADLFIKEKPIRIFWPSVRKCDVPQNTFGKLYKISKPVLGIFGTSSYQGKFTLQILLKELLEKAGYVVGHIGTEPHAPLLGMDYVYPMGYNSSLFIQDWEAILLLNELVHRLCAENDIIMVGSQANTIPLNFSNLSAYHVKQNSFLVGTQPDAVILCVNPEDDVQYILNTVKYIEGIVDCKVIGAVIFSLRKRDGWRALYEEKIKMEEREYEKIAFFLRSALGINTYKLSDKEDMIALKKEIINYFSS